jgi:hypothetical protein
VKYFPFFFEALKSKISGLSSVATQHSTVSVLQSYA